MADPKIELRSRKARSIVGKMPPRIIMNGSGVLFLVFIFLFLMVIMFPYRKTFEAKAVIQLTDSVPNYLVYIPVNRISELQLPQKVVLSTPDGLTNWEANLFRVSDTITIFERHAVRIVFANPVVNISGNGLHIVLNPSYDTLNVHITSRLQTMFERILSK